MMTYKKENEVIMDLSIIIPLYNTNPARVEKCFDSIKQTTSVDYECLVIDDGSDEQNAYKYKQLIQKYSNFKYFYKKNGGVSSARNYGLCYSKGEYITFVDSDDFVDFTNIKKYINVNKQIVFSNLEVIKDKSKSIWKAFDKNSGLISMNETLERLTTTGTLNGPYCKLIKRNLVDQYKISFNPSLIVGEDAVFFMNLLMTDPSMYFFNECSYVYINDEYTSVTRTLNHPNTVIENYNTMHEELLSLINKFISNKDTNYHILIKNANERYLKQIFNTAAELILTGQLNNQVLELITNSHTFKQLNDCNDLNTISKIRYLILKNRSKGLLWLIGKIRLFYLRIK